jgi:hypothetical protein
MSENDELVRRVAALEEEVEQLRHAVTSHAVIDQAIGVIAAVCRLPSQQSWDVLKQVSQHTNIKLREVARLVLRWVESGRLPDDIRPVMRAAVVRARERAGAGGALDEPAGDTAAEQPSVGRE